DALPILGQGFKAARKAIPALAEEIFTPRSRMAAQRGAIDLGADAAGTPARAATLNAEEEAAEAAAKVAGKLREPGSTQVPAPVQAPREVKAAKRFKGGEKAGIYRGTEAFGGITPQKLAAKRKSYVADAQAGAPYSKYWYDDTSKAILG